MLKFGTKSNCNTSNPFCIFNQKQFFRGNSFQKLKNCQFKLKFGQKTNSNILDLILVFRFLILNWKYSFRVNLVQKIKICHFKLKFSIKNNPNILNVMVVFTFPILNWKAFFLQIWSKISEIVKLSSNLVQRLIVIWTISWWSFLFLF